MENLDALFIMPPQWTPVSPHYALTLLVAELKEQGYQAAQRDLNIEFYNHLLSREHLEWARHACRKRETELSTELFQEMFKNGNSDELLNNQNHHYFSLRAKIDKCEMYWDFVLENIEQAKENLKNQELFKNPKNLEWSFNILSLALEMSSLPFHPSNITLKTFTNPEHKMNLDSVVEAVYNVQTNPFVPFFNTRLESLIERNPKLIGISIGSITQVVAGLTLAKMLKLKLPNVHISIGGNFFSRVVDTLQNKPDFFEHFADSVTYEEGELPVSALVHQVITGNKDFSKVQNLIYMDHGTLRINQKASPKNLDKIAAPDLDDLDLQSYLTPEIMFPIQASRGCYWNKCSFCDHDFGANFAVKSVVKVVEEMKILKEKYGIRCYEFIDECITPLFLEKMSDAILEEGLDICFFMYARTERQFTEELLQKAQKAGCRMIMWGLETGSKRISELINKGLDFDKKFDPLRASAKVGIWNFIFIFFGFPTETPDEAMQTIHMIIDHNEVVDSYGPSVFTLGKHTGIREAPEKYGIVNMRPDVDDLSTSVHHDVESGISQEQANKFVYLCAEICNRIYYSPLWFSVGFREYLTFYIDYFGRDFVKQYTFIDNQPKSSTGDFESVNLR